MTWPSDVTDVYAVSGGALRQSHFEIASILDSVTDGFVTVDSRWRYTYVNRNAERLLQHHRKDLIGKTIWDISPSALGSGLHDACIKAIAEQKPDTIEHYSVTFDAWFENRIFPGREGVSIFFRDITPRKRREDLSDALSAINAAVNSTLDFDEIMNRALIESAQALGADTAAINLLEGDTWTVQHVYGLPADLVGQRFSATSAKLSREVAETKQIVAITDTQNDTRINCEPLKALGIRSVLAAPLTEQGQVIGVIKFRYLSPKPRFSDAEIDFADKMAASVSLALHNARLFADLQGEIADRKLAEEALTRANERLSATLSSITDAYFALDGEWRFMELNAMAEEVVFASSPGELVGKVYWEEYPQVVGSEFERRYRLAMQEQLPIHFENKSALQDKWWEVHAYPRDERLEVYIRDITDRKKAEHALQRQLHLLQQALLPEKPSMGEGYSLTSAYIPASPGDMIGGDFYDVFRTEDGKTGILIGDVSGKGVEAASLAASARSTLRAFAYGTSSPSEALSHTNSVLVTQQGDFPQFVTVFLAIMDLETGEIRYSGAGHPPAVLYHPDGSMDFLNMINTPIGVFHGENYQEGRAVLNTGDKFVLLTDGITDARRGTDMFGMHGVERVLCRCGGKEPQTVVYEILAAVDEWVEGKHADDTALIVIERHQDTLRLPM